MSANGDDYVANGDDYNLYCFKEIVRKACLAANLNVTGSSVGPGHTSEVRFTLNDRPIRITIDMKPSP